MRVLSGFGCFICGSLAVLLCAAPANPDRHLKAALARMDAMAAFAYSDAALARPELTTAFADPNTQPAVTEQVVKVPLAEPDVNMRPLEAVDECVLTEECIDQYLWSVLIHPARSRWRQVQSVFHRTWHRQEHRRLLWPCVLPLRGRSASPQDSEQPLSRLTGGVIA
jgi:type II secretory pathway component PulM